MLSDQVVTLFRLRSNVVRASEDFRHNYVAFVIGMSFDGFDQENIRPRKRWYRGVEEIEVLDRQATFTRL